jgi:hypothetical protein
MEKLENHIKNGVFYFSKKTPEKLMEIINNLFKNQHRFRVWYGDLKTGKSWDEENDTIGTVGISTGEIRIALLIKTNRSRGGSALNDDVIVKLLDLETMEVLYLHPAFHQATFIPFSKSVLQDNITFANCRDNKQAERLAGFMNGTRHHK